MSVRVAEEEKLLRCRVHVELVEGIVHSVQDIYEKCMYVCMYVYMYCTYVVFMYMYVCMRICNDKQVIQVPFNNWKMKKCDNGCIILCIKATIVEYIHMYT